MANTHNTLTELFTDIGDSIRYKTGGTDSIPAHNFPAEINAITTGPDTSDATAVAGDILATKTAYVATGKVQGTIPTRTASNLTVDGAKITTQAGYYATDVNASVATATHDAPVIDITNTVFNTTTGNVEIRATHTQNTGYVVGNTTAVVGSVEVGLGDVSAEFNTESYNVEVTTNAGYVPNNSFEVEIGEADINVSMEQTPPGVDMEGEVLENGAYHIRATVGESDIQVNVWAEQPGYMDYDELHYFSSSTAHSDYTIPQAWLWSSDMEGESGFVNGNDLKPVITFNNQTGVVEASTVAGNPEYTMYVEYSGFLDEDHYPINILVPEVSNSLNIGLSTPTPSAVTVSGATVTGYVNGNAGYTEAYNQIVTGTVAGGALTGTLVNHDIVVPTVSVAHAGNIADIATNVKPSGTAGVNYYEIGFSNSVTDGSSKSRPVAGVSTAGYVTTANNATGSWNSVAVGANVAQPETYYVNKSSVVAGNISGSAYLENTGDYGFRVNVQVPAGYHTGGTVTKEFTTGIFPAPESKATADKMLTGYSLYDEDGKLITGSMVNQGAQNNTITTQGGTYTIPQGYHDGNGVVTATLTSGAYSASATNASVTPTVGGTITSIATTTKPSGTDGTNYYTIDPGASATNGTAKANIGTGGYLAQDTTGKTANVQVTVAEGTNYYIPKSVSTNSSSVSGNAVTATVTIPAGYNPGETVVVSNSVASTTHPNPAIDTTNTKLNTTSGNVEIRATHTQGTGYVTGGTTAITGNVSVGVATINAPSGSKTLSKPGMSFNAETGVVTATTGSDSVTVYANTRTSGYTEAGQRSGTVTITGNTNTYSVGVGSVTGEFNTTSKNVEVTKTAGYIGSGTENIQIGSASINAPSGSKTIDKPAMAFNTETGVVTATVSTTTATAYANVTTAGYTETGTKSGSVSITGNSNTYTVGVGTVNGEFNTTSGNVEITKTAGYITAGTDNVALGSATINAPSGSATQSKPTFSWDATNRKLTASVAATSGTAYANVTTAGYVASGTKSGSFSMGESSNTYTMAAAEINAPSGSAVQSKPTFSIDNTNGIVTGSVAATSGTAYANVTTAGYTATGAKSGTFTMTASSNTYQLNTKAGGTTTVTSSTAVTLINAGQFATGDIKANVNAGAIDAPSGSAQQSTPTFSFDATNRKITASVAAKNGTAYRNITTAGYLGTNTTGGNFQMTASSNTYTIDAAAINAPAGSAAQSTPSFSWDATNRKLTATVAATSGTAYANVTTAGYTATGTKSGAFTMTESSNIYTMAAATINAPSGSKKQSTPAVTINTQTGLVSASSAATSGTAYANVTGAGYTGTGTKSGTFSLTASDAGTLQLTVKSSSDATPNYQNNYYVAPYTNGVAQTIMNRNEYLVANHIIVNGIPAGAINDPSGSAQQSTPTFSFDATTRKITASVAAKNGTAYRNVTTAGYLATSSTGGNFQMTASSNTYTIDAAAINTPAGSAQQSTPTFSWDATNRILTASVAAKDGTAYANVTTAGYTAAGTKSGTFSMTESSNTYTMAAAAINAPSGSKQQSTPTVTVNTQTGLVSATSAATSGTAYANVTTAGYTATGTKSGSFSLTASSAGTLQLTIKSSSDATPNYQNNYYVTPYTNGTAQTIMNRNEYLVANHIIVNGVPAGAINTPSGSAQQSAPTFSVANSTGIVTASVAAKNGTAYRNVTTAGYLATSTTGGNFQMTSSSNTYQLNTKAGGTTYVDGTGATLVNAGQFVTSAVIAKAANVTYNSTSQTLTIPAGLVTVS